MTATSPMPGMARRRVLKSYSASSRISSGEAPPSLPVSATSIISPVTDTTGAISAWASSGSEDSTRARRSNTSNLARDTSTFQSKSTQTKDSPPLELERIVDTPGIPFITDSIGMVTSCSTSSAESPPASVWIVTRGTDISGKTSTARFCHVLNPATAAINIAAITVFGFSAVNLNIRFMIPPGTVPEMGLFHCTLQDESAPNDTSERFSSGVPTTRHGALITARPSVYESGCNRAEYETYLPPQSGGAVDNGLKRGLRGISAT